MRILLSITILLIISLPLSAKEWSWKLSTQRFKKLNTFERAAYNKGKLAYERRQYRGASSAFEQFKVEYENSTALSYAIFMQGLSLHFAKDRGKAIRAYNEVLDYFGDIIEDAAPALYWLGRAHFDNGDKRKGILAMKEMVEDEDYSQHPLAAGALKTLANNYWANKDKHIAVKYWKQVVSDFSSSNAKESRAARDSVIKYYSEEGRLTEVSPWLLQTSKLAGPELAKARTDIAINVVKVILYELGHNAKYRQAKYKKSYRKQLKELDSYLISEKGNFIKCKQEWNYYRNALQLSGKYLNKKKAVDQLLVEAQKYIKTKEKEKERDSLIDNLSEFLRGYVSIDRAIHFITNHSNHNYVSYKKAVYLYHAAKWDASAEQAKLCEGMADKKLATDAMMLRANIYRMRLNKQDEAIKLYQELSQPPTTLFYIADSSVRKGDHKRALTTWSEIENSFPAQAANAAWHKTAHLQKMGENKKAVAAARSLLKRYPTSGRPASQAHQLLESYGVDTGGGVGH